MAKTIALLLPSTTELLQRFGERLRLARHRRRLTAKQVAERAGMAPMTLRNLERGGAGVTMGAYLAVMQVLGIEKDLDLLGAADTLGRELQDARLTAHGNVLVRAQLSATGKPLPGRRTSAEIDLTARQPDPATATKPKPQSREHSGGWVEKYGFISGQSLVDLIDAEITTQKKGR